MRRRAEYLVEKRDGRREFLRATKLARSIQLALRSVGVDEDWRALEFANVVIEALRHRRGDDPAAGAVVLRTAELAEAAQQLMLATGQPAAAAAFGAVAAERARRRNALALLGRAAAVPPVAARGVRRAFEG